MSVTLHYSSATHNQMYFAEYKYNKVVVSKNLFYLVLFFICKYDSSV